MIQRYLMMMIQFAGIHNGFRNKNHLDNIDIVDTEDIDIVGIGIGDIEAVDERIEAAGEHIEVAGEHIEVAGEHMKAVGEHTEVAEECIEVAEECIDAAYHNIDDNKGRLAEVQQQLR
jgi:hypothetical protein